MQTLAPKQWRVRGYDHDRAQHACDRIIHAEHERGVVQLRERRAQQLACGLRVLDAARDEEAGDEGREPGLACEIVCARLVEAADAPLFVSA